VAALDLRLLCVVDLARAAPDDVASEAEALRAGGATLVVAGLSGLTGRVAAERLRLWRRALGPDHMLLAGGRADLAVALDLDGVQLAQDDPNPHDVARALGRGRTLGIELRNPGEADELVRWRVDYALLLAERGAAPQDLAMLDRLLFRARLAAPGTPLAALVRPEPDEVVRAIAAGADGVALPWQPDLRLAPLRNAVDEALARRSTRP